jgi:YbbR domain-containing protein
MLTQPIPNLTVDITGTEDHLNAFSTSSLQLTVDYDVIRAVGQNVPATVRLPVRITNTDPNIDLDDPPASIEAQVDSSGSASEPVQVVVSHAPPPGYQDNPGVATPATVTATGPEHELVGIVIKTEPIDLSNQRANFDASNILVYPYSAQGRYLSDVNLTPATVNVAITVVGVDTSRTSSVVLGDVTGTASGAFISAITYSPMTVVLQGSQDIINGASLATLTTGAIDVAGQTGTVTYKVPIETPTGISANPSTVTVTITVTLLPTPTPAPTSTPASSSAAT